VICTVDEMHYVEEIEEDELGGAWGTCGGGEEKDVKDFGKNPQKKETSWKT
jgi:hypothetical protein